MKPRLIFSTLLLFSIGVMGCSTAHKAARNGESGRFEPYDNMALLYGGNMARTNALWTEERLRPHVTYTDPNGHEHWQIGRAHV